MKASCSTWEFDGSAQMQVEVTDLDKISVKSSRYGCNNTRDNSRNAKLSKNFNVSPQLLFQQGLDPTWVRTLGSLDERSSWCLFLFLVSLSLSPDRYLMVCSHLLHANLGDGATETWRPSSPHPLPKSQTKRPRKYLSVGLLNQRWSSCSPPTHWRRSGAILGSSNS